MEKEFKDMLTTLHQFSDVEAKSLRKLVISPELWREQVTTHPILKIYEPNVYFGSYCNTYCLELTQLVQKLLSLITDRYSLSPSDVKKQEKWLDLTFWYSYSSNNSAYMRYCICRIDQSEYLVIERSD